MARRTEAADAARSSRAVATLLRLADGDLRDAGVLDAGRDPRNAPALAARAVLHMVAAVVVTERGWRASEPGDLGLVPKDNPLKPVLAETASRFVASAPPAPLADGGAPPMPDRGILRADMLAARALLKDLASRFEVDLSADAPAGRIVAIRLERPVRTVTPPAAAQCQSAPAARRPSTLAARCSSAPAARYPSVPAQAEAARPRQRPPDPSLSAGSAGREGRSPLAAQPRGGTIASTVFWSLMDRWRVRDGPALELIGHSGGLTKAGMRPRFKLAGDEIEMLRGLQEIDAALLPLKLDAAQWLHEPIDGAPFEGATPLALLVRARIAGVRAALRFILQHGLRISIST